MSSNPVSLAQVIAQLVGYTKHRAGCQKTRDYSPCPICGELSQHYERPTAYCDRCRKLFTASPRDCTCGLDDLASALSTLPVEEPAAEFALPARDEASEQTEVREGVRVTAKGHEWPDIPGGTAKEHAREKQPVIAYACLYPKLAAIAREHGYALALHGSLVADCDLIAVPWVNTAAPHDVLADALSKRAGGMLFLDQHENRPAGVRKHVIHLGGGPYLDLAVFPLSPVTAERPAPASLSMHHQQQIQDMLTCSRWVLVCE